MFCVDQGRIAVDPNSFVNSIYASGSIVNNSAHASVSHSRIVANNQSNAHDRHSSSMHGAYVSHPHSAGHAASVHSTGAPDRSTSEHAGQYHGQVSSCFSNQCGQPLTSPSVTSPYSPTPPHSSHSMVLDLNFQSIKKATYGFDNRQILSQDRFGVVFRGKIGDHLFAVKQLKQVSRPMKNIQHIQFTVCEFDVKICRKKCSHYFLPMLLRTFVICHFAN